MSMFLRLAESLDRSQAGIVKSVSLLPLSANRVLLHVAAAHGWEVERAGLESHIKAFEKTFDRKLVIEAVPPEIELTPDPLAAAV